MTITYIGLILLTIVCLSLLTLAWTFWLLYNEKLEETQQILNETQEHKRKLQQDITLLQTRVEHIAEDAITHFPSWQLFEDRLQQTVKENARFQLTLGLLVIEFEGICLKNNLLIAEIAQRFKQYIRLVDSVSRLNKETFVIMLTSLSKADMAAVVAQRILQGFMQPLEINGEAISLNLNIGIATFPDHGQESSELLLAAQQALDASKNKGAQRYDFFQPQFLDNSHRIHLITQALNSGEIKDQLIINYQPIVNVVTTKIICIDTILSWEHSKLGHIPMEELCVGAGREQKISQLFLGIFQSVFKKFSHWRKLGTKSNLLGVSLPAFLLQSSAFICKLALLMKETQFDAKWLLIEMKPEHISSSLTEWQKSFNMLHYLGVKLAIDGFGATSLSLVQLNKFPVNYLKLDKSLIQEMSANPQAKMVIQASLELAKNLGVELITQGIDTQEQMQLLKEMGCVLMEGKALDSFNIIFERLDLA